MTETSRLTADLRLLLDRHPRETWPAHPNLGDLSRFWLARHDWFRRADGEIGRVAAATVERRADPLEAKRWLAAALQRFLGDLEGHHAVEDHHYFPVFRGMEPRLAAGFDILDGDHEALHAAIAEIADGANAWLRIDDPESEAGRDALARFEEIRGRLGAGLLRHLDDEEDLIIPLILDRGEEAVG